MITKLLIANRGEIACRIIATSRRLGIATVAVFSEADAGARHVRLADEAVCIGPAPARESYLNIDRILAAAQRTGAQAIHPGYGFLSENADFADACERTGITFVGPPSGSIRAMGSKSAAKALMAKASVPLVPGYHGEQQSVDFLAAEAGKIGYPVLIKASAGGGGKGMRVIERADDFPAALSSCQREAASSFGNDHVLLEKYLTRPRHIEIQIFADAHGHCLYLFERDCSMQRRHQKVVEEAPAPGMTPERRRHMGEAAIAAALTVGYVGAGTVEFIVGEDGRFYFMEMNTRLQVEHPVTEMITGLDLVEWQLRVAGGEPLPLRQDQLAISGHAIEARIYAEDPAKGFLPSIGTLVHLAPPAESPHVRIDTGVSQGDEITPYYDPMIAKLIVWDADRDRARRRMIQALEQYQIVGVATNLEFLARLIGHSAFASAQLDTGLIERERASLSPASPVPPDEALIAAALGFVLGESPAAPHSPWELRDGWRLNGAGRRTFVFRHERTEYSLRLAYEPESSGGASSGGTRRPGGLARFRVTINEAEIPVAASLTEKSHLLLDLDGRRLRATFVATEDTCTVFLHGHAFSLAKVDLLRGATEDGGTAGGLTAPMPGRIVALLVPAGTRAAAGTPLIIMESMKMELTLVAPAAGTVRAFPFRVGATVPEAAVLVDFEQLV